MMQVAPTVLVVEDDAMSRDFMVRLLGDEGFEVEAVHDGPACLERLAVEPGPDLVLLDVSMPGLDGHEVLAWIRERWSPERLPVLMVSAFADAADVIAGLDAGANDYVTKPVQPALLLARANASLRLRRGVHDLVATERSGKLLEVLQNLVSGLEMPVNALCKGLDGEGPLDEETRAELLAEAQRARTRLEGFRGLAALRDRELHPGLTAVIDATLATLLAGAGD